MKRTIAVVTVENGGISRAWVTKVDEMTITAPPTWRLSQARLGIPLELHELVRERRKCEDAERALPGL